MSHDIFDYIIIGAGAGGATLAYELSRRTNDTILVLESGGPDFDPSSTSPKGSFSSTEAKNTPSITKLTPSRKRDNLTLGSVDA